MNNFRKSLEILINQNSIENNSDTPDFILAQYIDECLEVFDRAVKARDSWYGHEHWQEHSSDETT